VNFDPVKVPPQNQHPQQPSSVSGDPFARPAGYVTVGEWRILIAGIAGRLRLSQGFNRQVVLRPGTVSLIGKNDKSYALFVSAQQLGLAFGYFIGGDSRSANASNGIAVYAGRDAEQILLPGENLYAFSATGGTLVVTEVTV